MMGHISLISNAISAVRNYKKQKYMNHEFHIIIFEYTFNSEPTDIYCGNVVTLKIISRVNQEKIAKTQHDGH